RDRASGLLAALDHDALLVQGYVEADPVLTRLQRPRAERSLPHQDLPRRGVALQEVRPQPSLVRRAVGAPDLEDERARHGALDPPDVQLLCHLQSPARTRRRAAARRVDAQPVLAGRELLDAERTTARSTANGCVFSPRTPR